MALKLTVLSTFSLGHGGHETVDYTHEHLPPLLREHLTVLVENKAEWEPSDISHILEKGISTFDDEIGGAFLNLFPGDAIQDPGDEEVTATVNDPANLPIALRCMRGTTALVSLVDPDATNLWVVSLGDCSAGEYYVITRRCEIRAINFPSHSAWNQRS